MMHYFFSNSTGINDNYRQLSRPNPIPFCDNFPQLWNQGWQSTFELSNLLEFVSKLRKHVTLIKKA